MRRVVLTALFAGAALAACVGAASAARLSVSPETGFRVRYASWEPQFAYGETLVRMRCPVTLEGSFHSRTFAKVVSGLIGYVTRAVVGEASCRDAVGLNGEGEWPGVKMRFLGETLPWHVRYSAFSGVLPAIATVRITLVGPAIRITELPFAGSCLYRTPVTTPMRYALALAASGEVTSFNSDGTNLTPFSEGSVICSAELASAGNGVITQQTTTALLTVRLI